MKRRWLAAGLVMISMGGATAFLHARSQGFQLPLRSSATLHVSRVLDGDTIELSAGVQKQTVRLIGIDTPEVVDPRKPVQCFGHEASEHTKSLLPVGSAVKLETDPAVGATDKYGRSLAYVIMTDGRNLNELLVRQGFAHEYTFHDISYRYQAAFRADEAWARDHDLGLWSPSTCHGDTASEAQ